MVPKIAVHQFNSGITSRDGLGNTIFFVQELLRGLGFKSDIYVEHHGPDLKGPVKLLHEYNPSPDDLLLVHYSFVHDGWPKIEALRCRKALVYHSITPPKLYERTDPLFTQTARAYAQLSDYAKFVDACIAVSPYNARQLRERGLRNVTVIPFHKDFATVRGAPHRKFPYYDDKPVFRLLFVGRFTQHKCQHQLVDVVGALRSIGNAPLELVLVGHSDHGAQYKADIDKQIERLELRDRVIMTGSIPDDELYGHYRAADAFISFSEHEGFGVPLIEAMTLDVPVIAYAAAAVPDSLGGAGILIHDKKPETVFRHLLRLHEDRRFRGELVRRQRERVLWYGRDRIEGALRQWLQQMGAFRQTGLRAIAKTLGSRRPDEAVDFEAAPAAVPLPAAPVHYVVEGPYETSYSLACVNREIAAAMAKRDDRPAYIEPAEGVEDYRVNAEAARRLRREVTKLVRSPLLTAEKIVTIRQMHPPRPNGMLGDVRLMHLPWEESAIPQTLADMINIHSDGVVVLSEFCKRVARNSGVRLPISVIGDGIDHFPPVHFESGSREKRGPATVMAPFTFLHISSGLPRKGIEELLTAYCLAFSSRDPVRLVVKTFPHEQNVVFSSVEQIVRSGLAPAVQVIAEDLDANGIEFLYSIADAVVLPTRGEGFCLPAAEAMARGIPVIITGHGGQLEFCTAANAALIDYEFEPSGSHLKSVGSLWVRASVPHLVGLMKRAYQEGRAPGTTSAGRAEHAYDAAAGLTWAKVADRIEKFVNELDQRPAMPRKIRLAWVSTYNSRCGIATNSQNLVPQFAKDLFDITVLANNEPTLGDDPPNVVRLWTNREGKLDKVSGYIRAQHFDAVYIQFHFAFYDLKELEKMLQALHADGTASYLALHRTKDHEIYGASLREIAGTLKECTRLFVHGVDDVNRLKEMGIVDNVVLIPPGVIAPPTVSPNSARALLGLGRFSPLIGSFGFLVPPKGFPALIQGFGLFRQEHPDALLLMVTARTQGSDSVKECARCAALIRDLGLQDSVRLITDYIADEEEAIFLLSACDALLFPYQYSLEAASGAIRIGLASGRPVASTPLPIFAEFGDLVHQLKGITAADVANGMRDLLSNDIQNEEARRRQREWVKAHSWAAQARRLSNIIVGCFEEQHGVMLSSDLAGLQAAAERTPAVAATGSTLREMIEAEFQALASRDFITLAFRRTLGRDPTPEQLAWFEDNAGADVASVDGRWRLIKEISKFAESDAAALQSRTLDAARILQTDNPASVDAVLRKFLLRDPDPAERARFLTALKYTAADQNGPPKTSVAAPALETAGHALPAAGENGATPTGQNAAAGSARSETGDNAASGENSVGL